MSPACPGDGEEPGLGGGQVRKPERSVMKRLVREQRTAGPASNTFVGHSAWNFSGEAGNLGLHVFLASSFPPSSEQRF